MSELSCLRDAVAAYRTAQQAHRVALQSAIEHSVHDPNAFSQLGAMRRASETAAGDVLDAALAFVDATIPALTVVATREDIADALREWDTQP